MSDWLPGAARPCWCCNETQTSSRLMYHDKSIFLGWLLLFDFDPFSCLNLILYSCWEMIPFSCLKMIPLPVERRERLEERKSEKRKNQKKEDTDARKNRKIANYCIFLIIYSSGRSKSRLAKGAGAEPTGQIRDEKLLTIMERITSQNLWNTLFPDHFWNLRCRKNRRHYHAKYISKFTKYAILGPFFEVKISVCRCGAKHISNLKFTTYPNVGWLLEIKISKKYMPL